MLDLLVSPFQVQASVAPEQPLVVITNATLGSCTTDNPNLFREIAQVAQVRLGRDNRKRCIDIAPTGISDDFLDPARKVVWGVSKSIVETADSKELNSLRVFLYRDQNQYDNSQTGIFYSAATQGIETVIIAEESIMLRAVRLGYDIRRGHNLKGSFTSKLEYDEIRDSVLRRNRNGSVSVIPLAGYTFTPRDSPAGERMYFRNYPSCELLLAAMAVEQASLADGVIRLCDSGIKNREYAARSLVQLAGHDNLQVESAAISNDGSVNKLFSWGTEKSLSKRLRNIVRNASEYHQQRCRQHI
ncbi:MAG: hypothetical protein V4702_02955 [Patescibacteria group bacterium]